jgi:hypothetical protein
MYVSSNRVLILAALTAVAAATVGCKSHKRTVPGNYRTEIDANAAASKVPRTSPGEIAITPFEATTSAGQPSPYEGTDVATLDVAGVRLGMTPEQVVAALRAFDPGLYFSKRYHTDTNRPANYGEGEPESEQTGRAPFRQFVGIIAAKGTTFLAGEGTRFYPPGGGGAVYGFAGHDGDDVELPGDEPKMITVYFSLDAANHRVLAVALQQKFKTPRAVSSIIESVENKYPKDITISVDARKRGGTDVLRYWRYDQRMRLMSNTAAKREWHGQYSHPYALGATGLPSQVYESDTVALDAGVDSIRDNNQLTDAFGVVLYDESALYRFLKQSEALLTKFKADQVQQQVDRSKGSAPVKF